MMHAIRRQEFLGKTCLSKVLEDGHSSGCEFILGNRCR